MIPGVLVLVAVRLKSSRLPRKALLDLAGEPILARLMQRMTASETAEEVVVCTSTHPQDTDIAELAAHKGWACHRGHELDVMGRFLDVAHARKAHTIVRVTGDNPLTDPGMLDHMVRRQLEEGAEYSYTDDLPRGTRCEVMSTAALERCHQLVEDPNSSEYMTLMIRRPDRFKVLKVDSPWVEIRRPDLRFTIDLPADYAVVKGIYEAFDGRPPALGEVIAWVNAHPEIGTLNAGIEPKDIDSSINVRLKGD